MKFVVPFRALLATLVLVGASSAIRAADRRPGAEIQVLVDTDIGAELDGALALTALLACPEFEVLGITTSGSDAMDRAWMVCHLLTAANRASIPVAAGQDPQPDDPLDWQIQYRRHPAVVWNRTVKPGKQTAEELLAQQVQGARGKVDVIATGPLTNIARLLRARPELQNSIDRIIFTTRGAERDPDSLRQIRHGKVSLLEVHDAKDRLQFSQEELQRLFAKHSRFSMQLEALHQMASGQRQFDAVIAVASALKNSRSEVPPLFLRQSVGVDPQGEGPIRAASTAWQKVTTAQPSAFVGWLSQRIADYGPTSLPEPPGNRSRLIPAGSLPTRVHAWEDYDTDIEKRWWMAGKLETGDTPAESSRSCRSVLTQDFDDLQGNTKTMYTGVVFNPVPGPPMGPRTRLAFRYKLLGTDTLRVQLYSLSNGYHRYLSLTGLPQGRWENGAVDMTEMRRPDGSGGALAADERIDDIQFYVDPRAEVLIDQMVLYEAAPDEETRPFPRRIFYTGVFDTGKQGKEWPGTFEIVPHAAPNTWKHAQSVADPEAGDAWIRLDLRGQRQAGPRAALRFRYRLDGAEAVRVRLGHRDANRWLEQSVAAKPGQWNVASTSFDTSAWSGDDRLVNELQFRVPTGATLAIDDVLLYEP